jgi:hypothetical protein
MSIGQAVRLAVRADLRHDCHRVEVLAIPRVSASSAYDFDALSSMNRWRAEMVELRFALHDFGRSSLHATPTETRAPVKLRPTT